MVCHEVACHMCGIRNEDFSEAEAIKLTAPLQELTTNKAVYCVDEFYVYGSCASLIYINNCPTRCNTKQSIYYSASSLYMFRVSVTPIIGVHKTVTTASGTVQLPPSNVANLEVAAQKI